MEIHVETVGHPEIGTSESLNPGEIYSVKRCVLQLICSSQYDLGAVVCYAQNPLHMFPITSS